MSRYVFGCVVVEFRILYNQRSLLNCFALSSINQERLCHVQLVSVLFTIKAGRGMVFTTSGQVTQYAKRRYMLECKINSFLSFTTMTISVQYEDVLVTSAHHGQGDTIVSAATHDIGQLLSRLMEKLDERATTLACGAQFDLALRDAAMMRTLAPGSSLGYLRAGSIYQEQGRQRAAVMMYDQGLDRVPSCDPCYTQLGQCRSHALKEEDTKRVDFISRLPMDIIATTLIPLLFDPLETTLGRLSPLLSVSHTWRQSILQCNILTLVVDRSMMTPNEFEQSVEAYVPYVKSLFVKRTPVEESANDVVDLLVKAHFPAIRHLDLDCK